MKTKTYTADLAKDFSEDPRNANKGTERGKKMLDKSVGELGAGRSIVVDKNGLVIAGNKTRQAMVEANISDAVVVETNGHQMVVVKRMDLDLTDRKGKARQLAYADNRVGELDLNWDSVVIEDDIMAGLDLSAGFTDSELATLTLTVLEGEKSNAEDEWEGMPEFDQPDATSARKIIVHFKDDTDVESFASLIKQGITNKTRSIWFPQALRESMADKRYVDLNLKGTEGGEDDA